MMKVEISGIMSQVYLIPFCKVTYSRYLNGRYEFIVGWLKWEISFNW